MYPTIEDHGIIGNLRTAALVSTDGTMDFFCPLRFDNPTLFASLLDGEKGGYCSIRPLAGDYRRKQLYLPDTNVLITRFLAPDGIAEITDFMPLGTDLQRSVIVRRIAVMRGQVALRFECVPAFNYASEDHEAVSVPEGVAFYGKNSDALSIQSESCIWVRDGCAVSDLHLKAGQQLTFILTYSREPSNNHTWSPGAGEMLMLDTIRYWRAWVAECSYHGPLA
jgi:GH15 family glucan-1,4-alpha-glucosidase